MRSRHVLVVAAMGLAAACADSTSPAPIVGAHYLTLRRAWLPGERDSMIAFVVRTRALNVLGNDISDLAPQLFAADSTTVVVPDPQYTTPSPAGLARAPQFAAGWSAVGVDVFIRNTSVTPNDTLSWLGVLWYNPADSTWKGLALAATLNTTLPLTTINTASFNNSGDKTGAGAAEAQQSTGTYWEANGGQIQITQQIFCSGTNTVTSGAFKGGTESICFFGGQLVNVTMPRLSGTTAPASQTFSLDFRNNLIFGARLTCVFPSPCTGPPAPPARPGDPSRNPVREALLPGK